MSKCFVILLMLFCHIVDDYYLQGVLASMKQKTWWQENAPQSMYKYDYIVALIMHSLSWSFMVMLPISLKHRFMISANFVIVLIVNAVIHGIIDDMKANKKIINLVIDQLLHVVQIIVTAIMLL